MKTKSNIGWVYREPAFGVTPARIRVKIKADFVRTTFEASKVFDDNCYGAQEAADFITETTGGDNWKLEDLLFLGYRIFIV